jgi:hypothetical protein
MVQRCPVPRCWCQPSCAKGGRSGVRSKQASSARPTLSAKVGDGPSGATIGAHCPCRSADSKRPRTESGGDHELVLKGRGRDKGRRTGAIAVGADSGNHSGGGCDHERHREPKVASQERHFVQGVCVSGCNETNRSTAGVSCRIGQVAKWGESSSTDGQGKAKTLILPGHMTWPPAGRKWRKASCVPSIDNHCVNQHFARQGIALRATIRGHWLFRHAPLMENVL